MEQNIQKPSLPIKTKIAAWWMIGIVGIMIILSLFTTTKEAGNIGEAYALFGIFITLFPAGLMFFLPSLSLLKRKKWGWWLSIAILSLTLFSILTGLLVDLVFEYRPPAFLDLLRFISAMFLLPWMIVIPEKLVLSPIANLLLYLGFLIYIIPFILLLLDRKNFWKVAK